MSTFYLYRHIRPDLNVPFYVGIGTKPGRGYASVEAEYYRAYTFSTKNKKRSEHWNRIFNKNNQQIEVEILYESDSHEEIKNKEKEFIALHGRTDLGKGTLANHTDGGEGMSNPSQEQRKKISENGRGRKMPPTTLAALKLANTGKVLSEETKEKIRIKNTGRKISAKHKERLRSLATGRKKSPETMSKMPQLQKGWHHTEKTKEKISIARRGKKGHPHTEEFKLKMSLRFIGKKKSPQAVEKVRQANLGRKASEETRKKLSALRKGKKYPDSFKNIMKAATTKWWADRKANQLKLAL